MKWSLAIATYNRPDALQRCLEFAVRQSRPPYEIIIVDSSGDWKANRQLAIKVAGSDIRYEQAKVRGLTCQRNQAIAASRGDVLFLIDDDAFMHHDCAEEIMKVYEADTRGCVAGVGACEVFYLPGVGGPSGKPPSPNSIAKRAKAFFERELYVERLLLPYDATYPGSTAPPELTGLDVTPTRYFQGFGMTYRAPIIREVGFDESLKRYGSAEDIDASYRVSRFGALLKARKARVFHAQAPQARLSRHTRELLLRLNLAYLYRKKGYDPRQLMNQYRLRLLRRLIVDVLRDAAKKRASLPCARAGFQAILLLPEMLRVSDDKIEAWYAGRQEQIISRNLA